MSTVERRRSRLQQERSRRTREQILRAASRLWGEGGVPEQTTVKEICECAGVARNLFYFYFADKDQILLELGWETVEALESEIRERVDDHTSLDDVIATTATVMARHLERTPRPLMNAWLRIWLDLLRFEGEPVAVWEGQPYLGRTLAESVEEAQRAGTLADFDGGRLGQLLVDSFLIAIMRWARGAEVDLEEALALPARLILAGARASSEAG